MGMDFSQMRQASTIEDKIERGTDLFVDGLSFIPEIGPFISLYWNIGGKKLHNMYLNKVLIPQIQMGINPGLPEYQPFK